MSWLGALIGLSMRSMEVAQSAGLIWLFPVAFISTVFVQADTLPGPLQVFTNWNPISTLVIIAIFAPLAVAKYRRVTSR